MPWVEEIIVSLEALLINLFPHAIPLVHALLPLLGWVVGLGAILWAGSALLRAGRQRKLRTRATRLGVGPRPARFLAHVLRQDAIPTALETLDTPELLAERLRVGLLERRRAESVERFASRAARVLDEIHARDPAFDDAPLLFETVSIVDALDADARPISGYVSRVDARTLSVATPEACPWPLRQELLVTRHGRTSQPFPAILLLRPMPGVREWVLGHELVEGHENRRGARRVDVSIDTWSLDETDRTAALRERLRNGDRVDLARVRKTGAWARRHNLTIEDLSVDGALLQVDHEVRLRQRFHLLIPAELSWSQSGRGGPPTGQVAALPLAEVVSVRSGKGGRLAAGVRFSAMRLKERVAMADLVRRARARR